MLNMYPFKFKYIINKLISINMINNDLKSCYFKTINMNTVTFKLIVYYRRQPSLYYMNLKS